MTSVQIASCGGHAQTATGQTPGHHRTGLYTVVLRKVRMTRLLANGAYTVSKMQSARRAMAIDRVFARVVLDTSDGVSPLLRLAVLSSEEQAHHAAFHRTLHDIEHDG